MTYAEVDSVVRNVVAETLGDKARPILEGSDVGFVKDVDPIAFAQVLYAMGEDLGVVFDMEDVVAIDSFSDLVERTKMKFEKGMAKRSEAS